MISEFQFHKTPCPSFTLLVSNKNYKQCMIFEIQFHKIEKILDIFFTLERGEKATGTYHYMDKALMIMHRTSNILKTRPARPETSHVAVHKNGVIQCLRVSLLSITGEKI